MKLIKSWHKANCFWESEFIYCATLKSFTSGALYWKRQLFLTKTTFVKKGRSLSIEHILIVSDIKNVIWAQKCSQKPIFKWVSRVGFSNLRFVGTIGYGDSCLDFLFRHFKIYRLHAKRHDAAAAVGAHSVQSPSYWYLIGRGPSSNLPGHVTGLLFCLYVKLFLPPIFNSVDFWSSMSCIVLDVGLTDISIMKEIGNFLMVKFRDTRFVLQKIQTNKASSLAYKKLPRNCLE